MELDELIVVWRKQNRAQSQHLSHETLQYLLKQKSQGALSKIRRHLFGELVIITVSFIICNILFFLVNLPYTAMRWACFTTFDLILFWYIFFYLKGIYAWFTIRYNEDLEANLKRLTENIILFNNKYKLLNLPVVFLCIIMFAGSQNLQLLVPWMALEFLLWRSVLVPKLLARFEGYKSDLGYSLQQLQELHDYVQK
jgi:hypothetical protein